MIERDIFICPNASSANDLLPRSRHGAKGRKPKIMPTVTGKGAKIGIGCVVVGDLPELSLVYGNPARIRGRVNEKGENVEHQND